MASQGQAKSASTLRFATARSCPSSPGLPPPEDALVKVKSKPEGSNQTVKSDSCKCKLPGSAETTRSSITDVIVKYPSDAPTILFAPSDYSHIYTAVQKQNEQTLSKETGNLTKSQTTVLKSTTCIGELPAPKLEDDAAGKSAPTAPVVHPEEPRNTTVAPMAMPIQPSAPSTLQVGVEKKQEDSSDCCCILM